LYSSTDFISMNISFFYDPVNKLIIQKLVKLTIFIKFYQNFKEKFHKLYKVYNTGEIAYNENFYSI